MSVKHKIRDLVISFICFLFSFVPRRPAVFLFHSIADDGHWLSLSPTSLEKMIQFFIDHNYVFLSAHDLGKLKNKKKRSVCFTFDDGLENNYTNAVPILEKYNVPAVFFVTTDHVGKMNKKEEFKCMNWQQINELVQKDLFTIGAHSQTHPKFTNLSKVDSYREIINSKKIIEEHIDKTVDVFAFPYGQYKLSDLDILRAVGFKYNFTTQRRRLANEINYLKIPRYVVDRESYNFFRYMPSFGYELYWRIYSFIFKR